MADKKDPHKLTPANFGVSDFKKPEDHTTDQFGQQYSPDNDKSKWSLDAPAESRRAHDRADTDMSPRALHHTLGIKHNQASPGDHNHDGVTSKKIGPLEMDPANPGKTRAAWTIPVAPSVNDVVNLLKKFVEFRQV
ncbi:hypothetical protein [Streptomyces rochei]|uniref:hypothetical protein n=1 Tax=Streptomyces rochei TaxID=1928 RepID=UPI00367BE635